jgi:tetratricopeptide (TPR) repeat protein/KaiC/GvpD/RAD55 family RecA-like ATPase
VSIINRDLLANKQHVMFSPSVLVHLRQHQISYATYLELLSHDIAQGLSANEWGNRLAEEGNLTVACECWREAGLPSEEIHEKYRQYKAHWSKQISSALSTIQKSCTKLQRLKGLKPEDERQCDAQTTEAEKYADQAWFDLAQETLEHLQARLDYLNAVVEQQHMQERAQLLQDRDQLLQRLSDPACLLPSGEEGQAAAQRLLENLEQFLGSAKWNTKAAQRRIEAARKLYEGAPYNLGEVAQIMGEKLPTLEVDEKKVDEIDLPMSRFRATEVEKLIEEESQQVELSMFEHLQGTEAAAYPRTPGIDLDTEYRNESVLIQKEADKERTTTKNFKHAEELFKRALQLWRGNETAAKNYSTMLRHLDRTQEAIAVLEEGVQYAQERLPIYNLLTNYCSDISQYDKAREYGRKALRLVGDPRAEIGVLTNIYTLEVKAREFRKALEYTEAILRLNPNHNQMSKNKKRLEDMLAGDPQPAENLYETPDTVTELNIEISLLIREDLENCELTKVSPRILNNRTVSNVLGECERLQDETRKLHGQQYRERADYFLQSAKLVSQLLSDSKQSADGEQETEQISENTIRKLEKELGDALGTYTGVMGDRYYASGNMDSARDYFLEHVRVYKQTLPLLPRRRIAKYFQSFIPERIDLLFKIPDNESRQAHYVILEIIETTLREAESSIHEDVARGVLELACTSHLIVEYITRAIRTNAEHRQMFQPLIDILLKQQSAHQPLFTNLSNEQPEDVFAHLVNNRQVSLRQQESQLSNLIGSVGDRYRLVEAEREMNWFADLQREWSKTDRSFFLSLRDLVRESTQYFHQEGQFSDREHLAHSIITRANSLRKRLDSEPTSLGKTYISRIVYQLKRLIENAFQELQQSSLPILTARVVQTRWSKYNLERECHIEIINEGESPAIEVSLHVLPSETGDYMDDPKVHQVGPVFSWPHAVTVAIPVVLQAENDQATLKDAVDLRIRMDYHDRERTKKETPQTRLRLSLRDEVQFTRIANPYQTGLPIVDARMFMGRQELLEELATEMTHAGRTSAVVIYGQKRSGKTSILRNLETYLTTHKHGTYEYVIPVTFSMQSILISDEWMMTGLFYLIAQDVFQKCAEAGLGERVGELTWEQITQPPNPEIQFRVYLNKIRKLPSTRLVLLIDEFTELSARIDEGHIDRNIMKYLKSLIEQGFFSCVICGIDTMPRVLSKYANELAVSDPRTVGYLSHEAAQRLIEEPIMLPNGESRYTSPQVVEELIRLTAGSPYYIQFICHRLVEYMNRETRSPTITGADVDRVVRSLISSLDPYTKFDNLTRYRGDESQDTYETTLEGLFLYLLADEARHRPLVAFSAICQRASFVNEAEFLDIADQLETRQVIERPEGATRQYKIVVDLFRRWINVRRPIDDEALTRFRLQLEKLRG